MGLPVVIVSTGGLPVSESAKGIPVEVAANGRGLAVTIVASGGFAMSGLAPSIIVPSLVVSEGASNGTTIGTASVVGSYTGIAAYSLADDAGGKFAINSSSGVITKAGALDYETATFHDITVAVSGTDPAVSNLATVVAVTNVVEDTTPDAFSFTDVTDADLSTLYTSNTVTISGVDGASDVTITGGEYSKNGGAFTSSEGSAVNGDTFAVRGTSSNGYSTTVNVVLSVGGNVTTATTDTYSITTMADPSPGGTEGEPMGLLLLLTMADPSPGGTEGEPMGLLLLLTYPT